MSGKIRVSWRIIKPNTLPEHRKCKQFRALGPRFENAGHALCDLIHRISKLAAWSEIHIKLRKEE